MAAHEILIGDWYLGQKQFKSAIGRYRYVLDKFPKYWNLSAVFYRLADALARDGQDKEAVLYFTRVTQEAPGSSLAKSAQKQITRIEKRQGKISEHDKKLLNQPLTRPKNKSHWWEFWK